MANFAKVKFFTLIHEEPNFIMKSKNPAYYSLQFALCILISCTLLISCTTYPRIPDMEDMRKVKAYPQRELIEPVSEEKDYLISQGDRLKITVWDVESLTQEVEVSGDGSFSYPLLGRIKAVGLPVSQVEKEIRVLLISGEFLMDPQVGVSVTYKARCFFIQGEVKKPGRYELEKGTTVLKAISLAQGKTPRANLGKIKILREENGVRVKIPVELNDELKPQDVILVPRRIF